MKAKDILGEEAKELFSFLKVDYHSTANVVIEKCNEYIENMKKFPLCMYDIPTLLHLESDIKLGISSKDKLEKALLEEAKKSNEVIVRIQNLLGNQG